MRNCSPPDERRPQGPQTHRQTLIMSSLSSVSGTKLSPHAQNCPFQPVLPEQGELCTARTTTTPSRENFVPHQQPNRYKTLPTRPQMPISVRFARAGRTLYRRHHQEAEQGELCTAPCAKPGTKLPQHTHTSSPTGTKLPQHAPASSPTGTKLSQRPVLQRFREKVRPAHPKAAFFASFAPAGRIISRTGDRTGSADEGRMR